MVKFILYILVIPIIVWAMDSVNINVIFKKGQSNYYQARVFYMIMVIGLSYLVVNFLWDFLDNLSSLDYAIFIHAICVILSYAFSYYKDYALKGAAGWEMGLYSQLIFVAIYFINYSLICFHFPHSVEPIVFLRFFCEYFLEFLLLLFQNNNLSFKVFALS